MKRRDFLGKAAVTASILSVAPAVGLSESSHKASKPQNGLVMYASESGLYADPNVSHFVIGGLNATNSEAHEAAIEQIRQNLDYRKELKFRSNDRFKIPFVEQVLDYFVENMGSGLNFGASIIPNPPQIVGASVPGTSRNNNPSRRKREEEKFQLYTQILAGHPAGEVVAKSQSPFGPSQTFTANFEDNTGMRLTAVDSCFCHLLQLSDFLTGCVAAEIRGVTSSTKVATIDELRNKLGVSQLQGCDLSAFQVVSL